MELKSAKYQKHKSKGQRRYYLYYDSSITNYDTVHYYNKSEIPNNAINISLVKKDTDITLIKKAFLYEKYQYRLYKNTTKYNFNFGKIRVFGINAFGTTVQQDYGYIYDFLNKKFYIERTDDNISLDKGPLKYSSIGEELKPKHKERIYLKDGSSFEKLLNANIIQPTTNHCRKSYHESYHERLQRKKDSIKAVRAAQAKTDIEESMWDIEESMWDVGY